MEWSNESSLMLIDEYRCHPVLWDRQHTLHYSKSKKHEAWLAIAANLKIEVHEAKQKINSLLGSFRREKSRVRRFVENENGRFAVYKSKWFAFDRMNFLLGPDIPHMGYENDGTEYEEYLKHDLEDDSLNSCPVKVEVESFSNDEPLDTPPLRPSPLKQCVIRQRKFKQLEPLGYTPSDHSSTFVQYVGNKLRGYPKKIQAYIEHEISNLLFQADMGKFDYLVATSHFMVQNEASMSTPSIKTQINQPDTSYIQEIASNSPPFSHNTSPRSTPSPIENKELNLDIENKELNLDIENKELHMDIENKELHMDIESKQLNLDIENKELNLDIVEQV